MLLSAACGAATPTLAPSFTPLSAPTVMPPTSAAPTVSTVPTASSTRAQRDPTIEPTRAQRDPTIEPTRAQRDPTIEPTRAQREPTIPPTLRPTPQPTLTLSMDGQHAFPVAGDLALMTWTHYHWDGSNAVDIEAARRLAADSVEFDTFIHLPVVAVVSGTVSIADNPAGGLALLLAGADGYTYYYGHLSEQWVADGQTVRAGQRLGRIGNTGRWTQYIEPHLHFSIATRQADDWRWEPDVNAAEQFLAWFDLAWQDLNIPDYPLDQVGGWPLDVPAHVVRTFEERRAENPDMGSIDIAPLPPGDSLLPVYATLGGEVNVNRATVMGLRVQITNRPARTTIVYSFMHSASVADGDVVQRGDVVGYMDPLVELNYMLFVNDVQSDPAPTLDR